MVYFTVAATYRPAALRGAAAVVVMVVLLHLRRIARESLEAQASPGVEASREPGPSEPTVDPLFSRLDNEIRFSPGSDRYFEHILWPRILSLGERLRVPTAALVKPEGRRFRRGPSLEAIDDVITILERGSALEGSRSSTASPGRSERWG